MSKQTNSRIRHGRKAIPTTWQARTRLQEPPHGAGAHPPCCRGQTDGQSSSQADKQADGQAALRAGPCAHACWQDRVAQAGQGTRGAVQNAWCPSQLGHRLLPGSAGRESPSDTNHCICSFFPGAPSLSTPTVGLPSYPDRRLRRLSGKSSFSTRLSDSGGCSGGTC